MTKAQEIEFKKEQINQRIKALENKFEGRLESTQKTLSYTQNPSSFIAKRPFLSILLAGSLGLVTGMVSSGSKSKKTNGELNQMVQPQIHGKDTVAYLVGNSIKRRLIQLVLDKGLDEIERLIKKKSTQ